MPRRRLGTSLAGFLLLGTALTACNGQGSSIASGANGHGTSAGATSPLRLTHVNVSTKLRPAQAITLEFNEPLDSRTATPVLTPKVPGRWSVADRTLTFHPYGAYPPATTISMTVPGGQQGLSAANGGRLGRTKHRTLRTPTPPVTFAEQILARLHYLPLTTTATRPQSRAAESLAVYRAPSGRFSWRWSGTPHSLQALWSPTQNNTILRGALLEFQHDAGITADALLGPHSWKALLAADRAGRVDPHPFTYIQAVLDESPQMLSVWKDGHTVITSPVNGGVAAAPTPVGSFPIYERLTSTTMSGTNPDGSHYSDPGVPWVNYFSGGSAVHGFPRASYGSPQSVGCLELPIGTADQVWHTVDYGTLVTVINTASAPPAGSTGAPAAPNSSGGSGTSKPAHARHTTSPTAPATPSRSATSSTQHSKRSSRSHG